MTPQEFKAWFDGFSEGIEGNPTEKQWKKIKAKVSEISATPISPTIIREYVDRYPRRWNDTWYYGTWGPAYATNNLAIANGFTSNSAGQNEYQAILTQMGRDDFQEITQ